MELLVVLAVTGLLVSPVSWTHHWVWITPLVIVLLVRARTSAGVARGCAVALVAGWVFAVAIRLVWLGQGVPPDPETARYYRMLAADAYVLLGALSLLYLCWPFGRLASDRAGRRGSGARRPFRSVRPVAEGEQGGVDQE